MTNPQKQIEVARAMRAAEARARALVQDLDVAKPVLARRPPRPGRSSTCAHAVDALEAAVDAVWRASRSDASLRQVAGEARAAIEEARHHRHALAMSAYKVAVLESRRVSTGDAAEDLVQEACIGLIDAAKRFDPERGIRFATYAGWWARARITRARQRDEGVLRVSGHAREKRALIARLQDRYPDWSEERLAAESGVTVERLREVLHSSPTVVPLDHRDPDDHVRSPRHPQEMIQDEDAPGEMDLLEQLEVQARWAQVLDVLDEVDARTRFILERRWGLDGEAPETLAQIGRRLGLSRERVRQLEAGLLRRLGEVFGLKDVPRRRGRRTGMMRRVVAHVEKVGTTDLEALARELGESTITVGSAAQKAAAQGLIRRLERGVYAPLEGAV